MRKILFVAMAVMMALTGRAAGDVVVDGVRYEWQNGGYIVAGVADGAVVRALRIPAVVNGLDVKGIDDGAFTDNHDLESVVIEENEYIKKIPSYAFTRCENLKTLVLPEGITTIDDGAFSHCTSLTMVVIPSTVRAIGSVAFQGCTGVKDVYYLIADEDELNDFDWWDGVYHSSPSEAGGLSFNTVDHTTIWVPKGMRQAYVDCSKFTAWLDAMKEDETAAHTLQWIVNYGVVGREYTVADVLTGIYVDVNGHLYTKDDNRFLTPDAAIGDEVDYMPKAGLLKDRGNVYDQSNWVMLTAGTVPGITALAALKDYAIADGTITGILRDKVNPVIEVTSTPAKGVAATYVPNTYIPASTMSRTQEGIDGKTYAFVRPKPQEVAKYDWAIYGIDLNEGVMGFFVPQTDGVTNDIGVKGGFSIDDGLYEAPPMPTLKTGGYYQFRAVTRVNTDPLLDKIDTDATATPAPKRASGWTPYTAGGVSDEVVVYPLHLPDPIVVGIDRVEVADGDRPVIYYDLQGRPVTTPTRGIYITGTGRKIVK